METTAFAVAADVLGDRRQPGGLVAEQDEVGALRQLRARRDRLPADLVGERLGAIRQQIRAEHRLSPSPDERPGHVAAADEADHDWLKKPFSMSLARSSAEISTLRGVSMNTLSAIRCMPPSRA